MKADATDAVPELPLDPQSLSLADAAATQALGRWLAGILIVQPPPDGGGAPARHGQEGADPHHSGASLPWDRAPGRPVLLLLQGELGAGKTCLVQGLAEGLGINEPITSPTFALAQHYGGRLADGRTPQLVHLDLYRLEQPAAADELFAQEEEEAAALARAAGGQPVLLAVEWPERLSALPADAWRLWLEHAGAAREARWCAPEAGAGG